MDPLSQAFIGAAAAQSFVRAKSEDGSAEPSLAKRKMKLAMLAGVLGGMAPDLDVFIRSSTDALLAIQFHRHFTHSFIFIPVGGLIVGLFLFTLLEKIAPKFCEGLNWKQSVMFATIGFATHGLLDACTSYGTQLLWPFSNLRVAWNNVGIIDPIPTLSWLIGSVIALRKVDRRWARAGFLIALTYLLLGFAQRERALDAQNLLLAERGHTATRREVKPTVLQIFVWKSLYESDGKFYSDAIRVGLGPAKIYRGSGEGIPKFNLSQMQVANAEINQFALDIKRFDWFSDGWVARVPNRESENKIVLGDIRFSMLPNEIDPLWGIEFDARGLSEGPFDRHVAFVQFREVTDRRFQVFRNILAGRDLERAGEETPDCQDVACAFMSAESGSVISFPVNRSDSGIDVLQAILIMSEIERLMRPLVSMQTHGGFQWDFDWEKPWLGAGSQLDDDGKFRILLWGGLVRATKMSAPALEAVICHEFGHLLGGEPRQFFPVAGSTEREKHWSSAEGQSDWFAATECLPKLYRNRGLSSIEIQDRIEQASLDFTLFIRHHFEPNTPVPSLESEAPEAPAATLHSTYPSLQCRLDTYRIGAQCSDTEGSCPKRPRCWFAD